MKKKFIKKLNIINKKFNRLTFKLSNNINKDQYKIINNNYNKMKNIIDLYLNWKKHKSSKTELKTLINEQNFKKNLLQKNYKEKNNIIKLKEIDEINEINKLAKEDINILKIKIKLIENKINKLFKKKKYTEKIFLEIKSGTGGDEASIFAFNLLQMYLKYIEKKNWKYKIISLNSNNIGGYKNVLLFVKGKSAYNNLKFESGVHRVQRVPKTETQGRIHTSTCKIAVTPKLKDFKFKLNNKDIKIETFKSSGAGGQHVNKTNSAVRVKHLPTKIIVECQNNRSQHKNKKDALKLMKYKLLTLETNNIKINSDKIKKKLLGIGFRSEKIRTYNYSKNRFIDHRVSFKNYNLDFILNGNLEELIKNLKKSKKFIC